MKKLLSPESERRFFDAQLGIEKREDGQKSRKIFIRAAVFNKLSKHLSWGFRERIEEGAFDGADLTDVAAVFNHNMDILFARTASGTLKLSVDKEGLNGEFEAPDTTAGNDLLVLVERGDIRKASFQFIVDKDRWVQDPDEGEVRIIEKFRKIIDVSPVVFEAYPDTDVAKRSHDEFQEKNKPEEKPEDRKVPVSVIHAEAISQYMRLLSKH